jgi:hypothetical protein
MAWIAAGAIVALIALALLPFLVRKAPEVVRQVWSFVGVHRVEWHAAELRAAGAESGVDPCLLAAVMYSESKGRVDAVSMRGALGAFQLMPSAAGDERTRRRPRGRRDDEDVPLLRGLFRHEGVGDEAAIRRERGMDRHAVSNRVNHPRRSASCRSEHQINAPVSLVQQAQDVVPIPRPIDWLGCVRCLA